MSASWAFLAACAVLAVPTAVAPGTLLADWTYLAGLAGVVAAVWWGARLCRRGPARAGWHWIAAATSMWLLGDSLYRLLDALALLDGGSALGSLPDVLWLGSYPTLITGVSVMVRGRGLAAAVHREIRLDVIVVTAAAAVPAWQLIVRPGLGDAGLDLDGVLAIAYPLGDLSIFAIAFTLLLAPGRRGAAGRLLVSCLGITLVVDVLMGVLDVMAPQFDADRLDAALLVVNACLGAAALHPSREAPATGPAHGSGPAHMHRWRVLLLGLALVAVEIAFALPSQPTRADRTVMLAAALAVSITVLMRFYRVVRERESAEALLVHQALHDQLTGLANRSLLLQRLGDELLADAPEAPERHGRPRDLVLVYVDLDGFKSINDRYGHAAGDEVLRTVARRLERSTRIGDTVSRLGGDEFVVLCRDVPPEAAEALGDALHEVILEPIDVGAPDLVRVGASIGVYAASSPDGVGSDPLADLEALIRVADTAMYEAKHHGGGVRRAAARG